MSMSTHVIGFVPPDEKWKQMKVIWDACSKADIALPGEVEEFFDGEEPSEKGQEVEIPYSKWSDENRQGIEVEINKLPKNVKLIRFYNSW